jgi:hypothetical protein
VVAAAGEDAGKGGGHAATNWECARCADVSEGGFEVGDGDGLGTVPVGEPMLDGESGGSQSEDKELWVQVRGLLRLGLVKVVLVEDKGLGKDVA